MRAVRVVGPGKLEIADVPEPDRRTDVLIAVEHVGICGSDIRILDAGRQARLPRTLGHEVIGRVVDCESGSPYQPGTRVMVDPAVACGNCDVCDARLPNLCPNGGLMGRDFNGAFTEFVVAPIERLIPIPDNVSPQAAAMLQVLGTGVHAVDRVPTSPGQIAVVIGLGVAGQLISQLLSLRGMTVVGITRSQWKRDLASRLGATATAPPDDAGAVLATVTSDRGAHLVVEAVGTEATLSTAIDLAGYGANVIAFGTALNGGQGLPYYEMYRKELTIHNPRAAVVSDYVEGARLAAEGVLDLSPIVSHELRLDEAERAFELVRNAASLKVLLHPR